MKTQAERQRDLRDRRAQSGSQRRLNMWISAEAYEVLSEEARARGMTRMKVLDEMLMGLRVAGNVTPSQSAGSPETMEELPPEKVTASPITKAKRVSKKGHKKVTQSLIDKEDEPVQESLFDFVTRSRKKGKKKAPPVGQAQLWDDL